MEILKFTAEKRDIVGRKVKKLRKEGKVPANIFGKGVESTSVFVDLKSFLTLFKEAGETRVVELSLGGKSVPVLIHNIQKDPIDGNILHIDFYQVNLKQKVTTQVPLEFVGESPAEKQGLGTIVKHVDEVEIESLPTDIPEYFEIDLNELVNVGDQRTISDLKYDKEKIEILDDPEKIIVKVEELRAEEVEEPVVEVTEEGQPTAETQEAEGETQPTETEN